MAFCRTGRKRQSHKMEHNRSHMPSSRVREAVCVYLPRQRADTDVNNNLHAIASDQHRLQQRSSRLHGSPRGFKISGRERRRGELTRECQWRLRRLVVPTAITAPPWHGSLLEILFAVGNLDFTSVRAGACTPTVL